MSQYLCWLKKKNCPVLKIQDKKMENSKKETYLGDIIDESGTNKPNLDKEKLKDMVLSVLSLQ